MTTKTRTGYVLCKNMDPISDEVYATLEEVTPKWRAGISLRKQLADGTIVPLTDAEFRRANDIARKEPARGSRWRKDGWTYTWKVISRGSKWITLEEVRPDGNTQQVPRVDWPDGWRKA